MRAVLIIDDNASVRNTLRQVMQKAGYKVFAATNGLDGVRAFCMYRPDVVVTDILMPEQDGIATIRKILKVQPNAKIVAITGAGHLGKLDLLGVAAKFGAAAGLSKPFDPDDLLGVIHNIMKHI